MSRKEASDRLDTPKRTRCKVSAVETQQTNHHILTIDIARDCSWTWNCKGSSSRSSYKVECLGRKPATNSTLQNECDVRCLQSKLSKPTTTVCPLTLQETVHGLGTVKVVHLGRRTKRNASEGSQQSPRHSKTNAMYVWPL